MSVNDWSTFPRDLGRALFGTPRRAGTTVLVAASIIIVLALIFDPVFRGMVIVAAFIVVVGYHFIVKPFKPKKKS